jgi:hypothetical protein
MTYGTTELLFISLPHRKPFKQYIDIAAAAVKQYLIIGTFSENGPEKCSGLFIQQYSEVSLDEKLHTHFKKLRCITRRPSDTI